MTSPGTTIPAAASLTVKPTASPLSVKIRSLALVSSLIVTSPELPSVILRTPVFASWKIKIPVCASSVMFPPESTSNGLAATVRPVVPSCVRVASSSAPRLKTAESELSFISLTKSALPASLPSNVTAVIAAPASSTFIITSASFAWASIVMLPTVVTRLAAPSPVAISSSAVALDAAAAHLTPVVSPLSATKTWSLLPTLNICGLPLPSPIKMCPFVAIATDDIADVPLPIRTPLAVKVDAPVPPCDTATSVAAHSPVPIVPTVVI